jgi:3-oxoacyl-[acyl-carrier-protein] synthase III
MNPNLGIIGIEFEYPEFEYTTDALFEILGNKISEQVKNNIRQLGVEKRYFVKPLESYLTNFETTHPSSNDHEEPISELAAKTAKKCIASLGLKNEDITCLLAVSENNDYLSPGLSSLLVRKIGLSNFISHFNIQGMACSSFPKILELGQNLVKSEKDNILIVISGCNSGWYLPHLKDNMFVRNPKEIGKNQYDRESQIRKWTSTMFSFLFGDGCVAFVLSKNTRGLPYIKFSNFTHAVNFEKYDYRKACVQLRGQYGNHYYAHELTAGQNVVNTAVEYSKKVLMKSLGNHFGNFEQEKAEAYMSTKNKIMIHTGSMKILDAFKNAYNLRPDQINESYETLKNYGNLTGCSIPTIMRKALLEKEKSGSKGLLIGITMGFGLDIVEVEKII